MALRSVTITVQWALQGKNADAMEDYHLLAQSDGPLNPAEITSLLGHFSPGTLDELPQVAFSRFGLEGEPYLAIAIHEERDGHRDATGRRIVFTRFFCMPYAGLAAAAVSYQDMYEAFREHMLPSDDLKPPGVTFPKSAPRLVRSEQALRVAALLLTGKPVCIIGADRRKLADRVLFLDSVMALLPYGMRSQLPAATWTSRIYLRHSFRLFFQDSPRDADDHIVIWGQPEKTSIEAGHAREYLTWLKATDDAAEWLAGLTAPIGFGEEDVGEFLEQIKRLGRRRRDRTEPADIRGHVFISYVHEDAEHVDRMQRRLEQAGVRVWRDREALWPGQNWQVEIRRAIQDDALVFIACFSRQGLAKSKSYQNAELDLAIEQLKLRKPDDPWLIPVRLDDCEVPDLPIGVGRTLASLHRADLFGERAEQGSARLVEAVLRILGRDAGPTALPAAVAARPDPVPPPDPVVRALTAGTATKPQLLGFLRRPPAEIGQAWGAVSAGQRLRALEAMLGEPDGSDEEAVRALAARWEVVGADAGNLIVREFRAGRPALAESCLGALGAAGMHDAQDRLLGTLLTPRAKTGAELDRDLAFALRLLLHGPVPAHDDFSYCCEMLRAGDGNGWQARLISSLLFHEAASDRPSRRTAAWLDWLCLTRRDSAEELPEWVTALSALLPNPISPQVAASLSGLMSANSFKAIMIVRVARARHRLPEVLAVADQILMEHATAIASAEVKPDWWNKAEFDIDLWAEKVPPAHIAAVDVVRILLGGTPETAHATSADKTDEYAGRLPALFALPAMAPFRAQAGERILKHMLGAGRRLPGVRAYALIRTWSSDENLTPGLIEYVAGLPEDRRWYDEGLPESFWALMIAEPRLAGYVATGRLVAAARQAAQDPAAALRRTVQPSGVSNTGLALALYEARTAGQPVPWLLHALSLTAITRNIPPRELDDLLREFHTLLRFGAKKQGSSTEADMLAEEELFSCYRLITEGALGVDYGLRFMEYLAARLGGEMKAHRRLLRELKQGTPKSPGLRLRRLMTGDSAE